MDHWNINTSSSSSKVSAGKLMLSMRNDGSGFFYPSRSNVTGSLEDHQHSSASAAVRENLLQYGNFEGSDQDSADVEASDHEAQLHPVEKKRRLSVEQVRSLELNFGVENKLEPERKKQLAHELGLQPRQVAVWFQNRRARWKTKQLERDYEALKASYDKLLVENKKLQAEVSSLVVKLEGKAPNGESQKVEMVVATITTKEEDGVITGTGKNVVVEDMDVSNCKANKEGSPSSDGYTSEILDAEYQVEAVPVVEENVLPFEEQQQQQVLMDSPARVVIKDHHQPDGMVYDAHSNQLVLYRYEDYNNEFDNSSSSFYFSPEGISPWWT